MQLQPARTRSRDSVTVILIYYAEFGILIFSSSAHEFQKTQSVFSHCLY
jgi:hypothetical protein